VKNCKGKRDGGRRAAIAGGYAGKKGLPGRGPGDRIDRPGLVRQANSCHGPADVAHEKGAGRQGDVDAVRVREPGVARVVRPCRAGQRRAVGPAGIARPAATVACRLDDPATVRVNAQNETAPEMKRAQVEKQSQSQRNGSHGIPNQAN